MGCCVSACLTSYHGHHVAACSLANLAVWQTLQSGKPTACRQGTQRPPAAALLTLLGEPAHLLKPGGVHKVVQRHVRLQALAARSGGGGGHCKRRGCGCCGGDGAQHSRKQRVSPARLRVHATIRLKPHMYSLPSTPLHALKHVVVALHRRLVDLALGGLDAVPLQGEAEAVGAQGAGALQVLLIASRQGEGSWGRFSCEEGGGGTPQQLAPRVQVRARYSS